MSSNSVALISIGILPLRDGPWAKSGSPIWRPHDSGQVLLAGGFLHADDNYGLDGSFRREIARVFPDRELVRLRQTMRSSRLVTSFPTASQIHEHDGAPAQALAVLDGERIMVFYTFSSDLGTGGG